jgi:hypothetical protein
VMAGAFETRQLYRREGSYSRYSAIEPRLTVLFYEMKLYWMVVKKTALERMRAGNRHTVANTRIKQTSV